MSRPDRAEYSPERPSGPLPTERELEMLFDNAMAMDLFYLRGSVLFDSEALGWTAPDDDDEFHLRRSAAPVTYQQLARHSIQRDVLFAREASA